VYHSISQILPTTSEVWMYVLQHAPLQTLHSLHKTRLFQYWADLSMSGCSVLMLFARARRMMRQWRADSTAASVTNTHTSSVVDYTIHWVVQVLRPTQHIQCKIGIIFVCLITLSNINRFSNLLYCQYQENISNNTITKDPTTPQVCCYTTL